MLYYDLGNQALRRQKILKTVVDFASPGFDDTGKYIATHRFFSRYEDGTDFTDLPAREKCWFGCAFLSSDDEKIIKKANAILRRLGEQNCIGGSFSFRGLYNALFAYRDKIEDDVFEYIKVSFEQLFATILNPKTSRVNREEAGRNFPMMDTTAAIIGGRYFGNEEAYKQGKIGLQGLKEIFMRRGSVIEYTSPTYAPIYAQTLSDIANCELLDDDVREMATFCFERVMYNLFAQYHPEIGRMCGPYSRAYFVDLCGHTHCSIYIFYIMFGDKIPVDIFETMFKTPLAAENEIIHNSIDFMYSECALYAMSTYKLPQKLIDLALNKNFPVTVKMKIDKNLRINDEPEFEAYSYTSSETATHSYLTKDYGFGIASNEHSATGQTSICHIIYKKSPEVKCQADIATAFSGLFVNDDRKLSKQHQSKASCDGRRHGIAEKNDGIIAYRPKVNFCRDVTSIKCSFLFPAHTNLIDELYIGGVKYDIKEGVFAELPDIKPIVVSSGQVYIGYKSLKVTEYERKCAIRAEKDEDYVKVSVINYEGEKRDFDKNEFMAIRNGFAVCVRSKDEISFNDFCKMIDNLEILDYGKRERFIEVKFETQTLAFGYDMVHGGIAYRTINGYPAPEPKYFCTGIELEDMPYMQ